MFTSDINKKFLKTSFIYLNVSLFLALFGAVYEHFSHGVYSYFMIYAFSIPLVFGTLFYFIKAIYRGQKKKLDTSDMLYGGSIAVFTAGSITKGILDIYGTESSNMKVYLILGILLFLSSAITKLATIKRQK